jgi:CRP-like cAMP-binding protein
VTGLPISNTGAADALITKLRSIGSLSLDEEAQVRQLPMRVQSVSARQDVVTEGDRPIDCCLVLDGFFFGHKLVNGGERQTLSFHLRGDMPDLQALHVPVMDYSISSLIAGRVAFIAHVALRGAIMRHPGLGDLFWRLTLLDAAIYRAWIASIGRRSASQRIAHLFCEVYTRMKELRFADEAGFTLPMTQEDIGHALGLSAVHVNRSLQQLRGRGVIVSRGRFHGFTDWDRLRQAGDFDPAYLARGVSG